MKKKMLYVGMICLTGFDYMYVRIYFHLKSHLEGREFIMYIFWEHIIVVAEQ